MALPTNSASFANVAIRAPSPVPLIRIANVWSVHAPPTQTTAERTCTNFSELYVVDDKLEHGRGKSYRRAAARSSQSRGR